MLQILKKAHNSILSTLLYMYTNLTICTLFSNLFYVNFVDWLALHLKFDGVNI